MALTDADIAEVDRVVRTRLVELERDLRRELASAAIQQAVQRAPTVTVMPCYVQTVGVTVGGILLNSLAECIPDDDSLTGTAVIATRIGSPAAGQRGVLMFVASGGVYVLGPVPI